MASYSHILLAVDFSDGSQAAADKAAQLAGLFNARLSLVHVVEFLGLSFNPEFPIPDDLELERRLAESADQRLRELALKLGHARAGIHVQVGSPKHEICRVAEESAVDLIVVGSHGRHGLQLLLGSTANGVLHLAPCDVLAVSVGK
ncbi:MAG: universal stress protein [Gammaproteobacteria bacterium]|nr:universal stress protein [Gammaproteobacteria bacterium]MBU1656290.1 universal stress protein [Gammaproteobacteria bacterium]MBU1959855.1 universal stress protein [Gammaproteobacteria bacterium]